MELDFFKKKQLVAYLNTFSTGRFQLKEAGVEGTKIAEYPVKVEFDRGESVMTEDEALDYLEVMVDNQMEAVLNAVRFVRVLRKREIEDSSRESERFGVFEGLQEALRRGGVPGGIQYINRTETRKQDQDAETILVESLREEAIRRLREKDKPQPAGNIGTILEIKRETETGILNEVLIRAYSAGRVAGQELRLK